MDDYLTIREPGHAQTRVLGSRFVGSALGVSDAHDLETQLEAERQRYHDATHWCFAARFGLEPNISERASDAGEPKGTAGTPLLQQLQRRELTFSAVIVTRYFGGTKLGTGNLARAYADCAAQALDAALTERRKRLQPLLVKCPYDLQSLVYHIARRYAAAVEPLVSASQAEFRVLTSFTQASEFTAALIEESSGRIVIECVPA